MSHNSTKYLYDNCEMLNPDGKLMCYISQKLAKWYIKKDLAESIQENPFVIKLKFQPKGVGETSKYGLEKRENMCVVCGIDENLSKHHVIPKCYRKHLPIESKAHSSKDILLLCVDCHREYEIKADKFKENLCERFLGVTTEYIFQCRKTYLKNHHLKQSTPLEIFKWSIRPKEVTSEIIKKVIADNKTEELILLWRNHFLENTQPKFLSEYWENWKQLLEK